MPTEVEPLLIPQTLPATIPGAVQFDIESRITGRSYRIFVQGDARPAPPTGYPVVYALDASISFATAASQIALGRNAGWPPVVLVAIGYPEPAKTSLLRNRDLTPSQPDEATRGWLEPRFGPINADDYGGADAFHRFMVEELRPLIDRMYKVDPSNHALIGYSFGGLFVLHVMFNHPDAYRTFVAGSPSIWWNDREVLQGEAGFVAAIQQGRCVPRLLITSGEWEQSEAAPDLPPSDAERAREIANRNRHAMVENARALAARLGAVEGQAGYDVRYTLFVNETHLTAIPAATSRAIAFAIASTGQGAKPGAQP